MRRTMTRDFYRPRNTDVEPFTPEGTDLEVWKYDVEGNDGTLRYFMTVFGGKRSKPDSDYWYRTPERRDEELERLVNSNKERAVWAAERRAARAKPHTLVEGDLLKSSWGYDQTNVDFYMVVERNGKTMVTIEKIGSKAWKSPEGEESEWDDAYVSPDPEYRSGVLSKHRVNPGSNSVRIASYASAYPTEVDSKHYETPFGMGH